MTEPGDVRALIEGLLANGGVASAKIVGGGGRRAVVRKELVEAVRQSDPRVSADQVDAAVEELGGRRSRLYGPTSALPRRPVVDEERAVFELPRRLLDGDVAIDRGSDAARRGPGDEARVWDLVLVLLAVGAVIASGIEHAWVFAAVLAVLVAARLVTWATRRGRSR